MTFSQMMMLIAAVGGLMILLDFLLGLVKKDWKLTPWEEEERRHNDI
jgi:hypothetical protein